MLFSTDWSIAWHRRSATSSADFPERLLKLICLDAVAVNYSTFSQDPELTCESKWYRGCQRQSIITVVQHQ